jgi:hypothetical protein
VAGVERYLEISELTANELKLENGITITGDNIYFIDGVNYKPIKTEVFEWESTE